MFLACLWNVGGILLCISTGAHRGWYDFHYDTHSPVKYNPFAHIITKVLNEINHDNHSIDLNAGNHSMSKINSVQEYARKWVKRKWIELSTLYYSNRPSILRLFHVVASKILTNLWIILILVPFRKCRLGKRLTFVHFTLPFLIKCWNKIIKQIIHNILKFLHCKQRYKFILLGHDLTYFVKHETNRKACYTKNENIRILEFLINILVRVWLTLFFNKKLTFTWEQTVSSPCRYLH